MLVLDWIVSIIVIIGAINWGLVGLFQFDLVHYLFNTIPVLMNAVYIIVGIAGIVLLIIKLTPTRK